jgi:probable DNA metabolism protein
MIQPVLIHEATARDQISIVVDNTIEHWRELARQLWRQQWPPELIAWSDCRPSEASLFGAPSNLDAAPTDAASIGRIPANQRAYTPHRPQQNAFTSFRPTIPESFLKVAKTVSYARNPKRWHLLYAAFWRLTHHEPHLFDLATDDLVLQLVALEKSVRRDAHKTKAFVRFRTVLDPDTNTTHYVAFHRPDHYPLRLVADFFTDRFSQMHFTIITPDESLTWDGAAITFSAGLPASAAPSDDGMEKLWRTYYRNIFNPARIKLQAMKKELPVRHWKTLPEASIIPELLAEAPRRVENMLQHKPPEGAEAFIPRTRSLPQLAKAAEHCRGCDLYKHATHVVFGSGPKDAKIILVGEQPGDKEDLEGKPFIGPAGQLLSRALEEAGIDRQFVYVTNAVKHFKWEPDPRGKRRLHKTPGVKEMLACRPWLMSEIAALNPTTLVALGATATRSLLGNAARVTTLRGQFVPFPQTPTIQTLVTIHPSLILRVPNPEEREVQYQQFVKELSLLKHHL